MSKIVKAARLVNKMTGATNLAKYLGEGYAKRKNPAVQRTVSGKEAIKSAGKTLLSAATVAGGGMAVLARAKTAKATVHGASKAYLKRTYSGHEKEAFRQAAKRIASRKK